MVRPEPFGVGARSRPSAAPSELPLVAAVEVVVARTTTTAATTAATATAAVVATATATVVAAAATATTTAAATAASPRRSRPETTASCPPWGSCRGKRCANRTGVVEGEQGERRRCAGRLEPKKWWSGDVTGEAGSQSRGDGRGGGVALAAGPLRARCAQIQVCLSGGARQKKLPPPAAPTADTS